MKEPDNIIQLDESEFLSNPIRFRPTGERKIKQSVRIQVDCIVDQYEANVYYDTVEKKYVCADFPEGLVNEVTYHPTALAFAAILHSFGNVSYDKTRQIISEITDGKIEFSKSTLAGLEKRFSSNTVEDRNEIVRELLLSPYLHVDGTSVSINGKLKNVLGIATKDRTLYFYSEHKGKEAVKAFPFPFYTGAIVSDAESTFMRLSDKHQCCHAHKIRYLKAHILEEPTLSWHKKMLSLLYKMENAHRLALDCGKQRVDDNTVSYLLKEFDHIIALGKHEYQTYNSPLLVSIDGPKTLRRLEKNKEDLTYFLFHPEVPYTNNTCERALRSIKMHTKNSGGFRSPIAAEAHLNTMSVIITDKWSGNNVYQTLLYGLDNGLLASC